MTTSEAEPVARESLLEVRGLGVDFWDGRDWQRVVTDLSYTLRSGEVLAVVGESGAGKSVSSMGVLGLLPEGARVTGSARLGGVELIGAGATQLRQLRGSEIATIFQEPMTALNPVYTVGFQISEAVLLHVRGMSKAQAKRRALELLAFVELPDPEKAYRSYPHELSGGQRQRAMIAQAISCDPRVLVADEPTTALDVTVQAEILDLLRSLHRRLNSAILLITHDMGVVADLADQILVMKDGRMVEQGAVAGVFTAPQHPYTRDLLSAVPHLGQGAATVAEPAPEPAAEPVAEPTEKPVLRMREVAIEYPRRGRSPVYRAAEGVSLELSAGQVLGLVGESGSGKTTLARAVVGLLPAVEGVLEVSGQNMVGIGTRELREVRRQIGIVFQDPGSSLNPRWPLGQSIAEPLLLAQRYATQQIDARVAELLDLVELPLAFRNRYPHELSGGQRQRIGIARALALDPVLLVADEPTSALDVSVQARVLELLQQIQREKRFATLFVSHDLAVVDLLADSIAVMQHGRIVEQGSTDQILRNPQNEYTRRLISSVPVPDPEEQRRRREARAQG